MMKPLLIAAVLALSGCASYSERQAQEPIRQAETTKSPEEVVGCAMPVVMDTWRNAAVVPDGESRAIVIRDAFSTAVQATFTATPDGLITLRGTWAFIGTWDSIQHCL